MSECPEPSEDESATGDAPLPPDIAAVAAIIAAARVRRFRREAAAAASTPRPPATAARSAVWPPGASESLIRPVRGPDSLPLGPPRARAEAPMPRRRRTDPSEWSETLPDSHGRWVDGSPRRSGRPRMKKEHVS